MGEGMEVGERRVYDWLPKEDFDRQRESFIEKNKGQFLDFFNSEEQFANFTTELQEAGAELITRFFFGVHMAYRRFGFKYPIYGITYDVSDRNDYDGIGFHHERNEYIVKVKLLRQLLENTEEDGRCFIQGGGIERMIPAGDFFEITGVEEAAHLMFFNEKGHSGKGPISGVEEEYKYYTSDMESRALKWKLAYVKRYFPQYQDSLVKTSEKVKEIRLSSN